MTAAVQDNPQSTSFLTHKKLVNPPVPTGRRHACDSLRCKRERDERRDVVAPVAVPREVSIVEAHAPAAATAVRIERDACDDDAVSRSVVRHVRAPVPGRRLRDPPVAATWPRRNLGEAALRLEHRHLAPRHGKDAREGDVRACRRRRARVGPRGLASPAWRSGWRCGGW